MCNKLRIIPCRSLDGNYSKIDIRFNKLYNNGRQHLINELLFVFFLQITIMILIGRRLAIQPCAFYPTASAPKTAPEYQTTCRPRKSLRWLPSPLTMPSTTTTSNCTRKYSMANAETPTGVTSKPLSSCRTSTPTTRRCRKPTGKDTKSQCTL